MKIAETYETTTEQITSSMANENKPSTTTSQTAEFVDANKGEILTFPVSASQCAPIDDQSSLGLADFLSRPVLISTHSWTTSAFTTSTIYPWQLFHNNIAIKYRLQNFALIRGDLKIKVVVNCSPFYYGALIAYYTPLYSQVPGLASTSVDFVTVSQRPHIWVYPQTSSGGEMTAPFFYNANYLPLANAINFQAMGSLTFKQYTALTSANGATTNGCTIQVYAWLENAQLQGNSTVAIMQSGKDEYGNGPISAPAAALSNWVKHLKSTPVIGKYATATQIGASAVSQIAKLFGWSNVPVIEDVKPVKNLPFHDLASAHLAEPVTKMTLDPKAEISVSPEVVGLDGTDELAIAHLAQKESFLTSSVWASTDAVGTQYFTAAVHPFMYDRGTASSAGTYGIAMTPICWTSRMFTFWRGDIIYRFKVICSRFHQGRLRISWDPYANNAASTDTTHVILTKIIDLAESDEVEFRVPYMQHVQWCGTIALGDVNTGNNWGNGSTGSSTAAGVANGVITVKCLTNLSAPLDTASVTILTFVRAADNFMLANPCDLPSSHSYLQMQSGVAEVDDDNVDNSIFKVNFGDPVLSLRTLLRRSVRHDTMGFQIPSSPSFVLIRQGRFPHQPGYDANGVATANGVETPGNTYGFNPVHMTPLSWVCPAFIGNRGSIRWHYNMYQTTGAQTQPITMLTAARGRVAVTQGNQQAVSTVIPGSFTKANMDLWKYDVVEKGCSGLCVTNQMTQTGVSIEMPMNTNYKFCFNVPSYSVTGVATDGTLTDSYAISAFIDPTSVATTVYATRYVCAGTDFNLHFFLNVPVLYYNSGMGTTY
jgi:hypothetical protein